MMGNDGKPAYYQIIRSKPNHGEEGQAYRDGWERTFGKKKEPDQPSAGELLEGAHFGCECDECQRPDDDGAQRDLEKP